MHKGSQAYTEYTFDESVIEYIEENEHLEECRMGHIHSHNTMSVFFSGTDWSELEDNAPNHNYYLSLIVNNFMDFCAKVCFIVEAEDKEFEFEAKDEEGKRYIVSKDTYTVDSKLVVYDCEIESPKKDIEVQQNFTNRVERIIEKAKTVAPTNSVVSTSRKSYTKSGEDWSNWSTDDVHWTSRKDTLADAIEENIDEFALFVMNTGNDISEFKTIEDLCDYYESFNLTGVMLAGNVANTYNTSYLTFFKEFGEDLKDSAMYEKALDELILELEHTIRTTKRKTTEKLLEPSLEVLKKILERFNKQTTLNA